MFKTYYLDIRASRAIDHPIYCVIESTSHRSAIQEALDALQLEPECFGVDDQISSSEYDLPIHGPAINEHIFWVSEFIPGLDKLIDLPDDSGDSKTPHLKLIR